MKQEKKSQKPAYKVSCAWCGAVMRPRQRKDSQGMCLKCYYRMLGDYLHATRGIEGQSHASER